MCGTAYGTRGLEPYVADADGAPDPAQVAFLVEILPRLPCCEAESRRRPKCVDEHDLNAVSFEAGFDFVLAFSWGDGEWGRTIFVKMVAGEVVDADIISD